MRATIISDDSTVGVDGVFHVVDCSTLPADVHAVQWYETAGEVEYKSVGGVKPPNEAITDFSPYQPLIDLWQIEQDKPPPDPSIPP